MASRTKVIDIHAHFFPLPFLKALDEDGGPPGFHVEVSTPESPFCDSFKICQAVSIGMLKASWATMSRPQKK